MTETDPVTVTEKEMISNSRIWAVDDSKVMRDTVEMGLLFEYKPENIEVFSSAEELLKVLDSQGPPDLIISDLNMPGMNGDELYQRIQELHPDIVFIFLTASSATLNLSEQIDSDRVFTKPLDLKSFLLALKDFLLKKLRAK